MSKIDIEALAKKYGSSVDALLDRLRPKLEEAGLFPKDKKAITPQEKESINEYLHNTFGASSSSERAARPSTITLHKRSEATVGKTKVAVKGVKKIDLDAIKKNKQESLARKKAAEEAKLQQQQAEEKAKIDKEAAKATVDQKPAPAAPKPQPKVIKHKKPVEVKIEKSRKEAEEEEALARLSKSRAVKKVATENLRQGFVKPVATEIKEVKVRETNKVSELAQQMSVKAGEVIKFLMGMGLMATINQSIDQDTATLVVEEMGHKPIFVSDDVVEENLAEYVKSSSTGKTESRPPVVTIMGHVDHGKTSLLDAIRETQVTAGEAGGITQHIGAYHVETDKGVITFLDTPGHEVFTAMRARGAKSTDIVVLVVAADDGVMPQTIEAVQHSKAAGVPIVVAVNKMDKDGADPERVTSELSQHEVIPESWGGEHMFVNVSAKTGQGLKELLDAILLQAEVLELQADVDCAAKGVVIESRVDKGRGNTVSVLVQAGQLKKGDIVLAGWQFGRVRALLDENGKDCPSAGPSIPVEILGLNGLPAAGDEFVVVSSERQAKEVALFREAKHRQAKLAKQQAAKMENMFSDLHAGDQLNVVVKADVQGSAEALAQALKELKIEKEDAPVTVKVVSSAVGGINQTDVDLAVASNAVLVGFNVRADATAREKINNEGVKVMYSRIVYDIKEQIEKSLLGLAGPIQEENMLGVAEVRDIFSHRKTGNIAGCMVTEKIIKRNNKVRVVRDGVIIFDGEIGSLRRGKDDAAEVQHGMECGIVVKNFADVKVGDQLEVYEVIQKARTL